MSVPSRHGMAEYRGGPWRPPFSWLHGGPWQSWPKYWHRSFFFKINIRGYFRDFRFQNTILIPSLSAFLSHISFHLLDPPSGAPTTTSSGGLPQWRPQPNSKVALLFPSSFVLCLLLFPSFVLFIFCSVSTFNLFFPTFSPLIQYFCFSFFFSILFQVSVSYSFFYYYFNSFVWMWLSNLVLNLIGLRSRAKMTSQYLQWQSLVFDDGYFMFFFPWLRLWFLWCICWIYYIEYVSNFIILDICY